MRLFSSFSSRGSSPWLLGNFFGLKALSSLGQAPISVTPFLGIDLAWLLVPVSKRELNDLFAWLDSEHLGDVAFRKKGLLGVYSTGVTNGMVSFIG